MEEWALGDWEGVVSVQAGAKRAGVTGEGTIAAEFPYLEIPPRDLHLPAAKWEKAGEDRIFACHTQPSKSSPSLNVATAK